MNLIEPLFSIESFEHPWVLFFLAPLPIFYLYLFFSEQAVFEHFLFPSISHDTKEDAHASSRWKTRFKRLRFFYTMRQSKRFMLFVVTHLCFFFAYICVTCALAGPYGNATLMTHSEGLDIMFVLDMSSSMKAYDYSREELEARTMSNMPTPNRFESALSTLQAFIKQESHHCSQHVDHPRCDRLGLVVFGNQAFLDIPLTTNYDIIQSKLTHRAMDDIPSLQTAIGDGIMRAVASLRHSDSKSKVIILLTDGDRRGGRVSIAQSIKAASTYNVRVYPILIGNENESYIGIEQNGSIVYQKANYPTNFPLLETIASKTNGQAFRSLNASELMVTLDEIIDTLEKSYHPDPMDNRLDYSRVFLVLTFILVLLGYFFRVTFIRIYPLR